MATRDEIIQALAHRRYNRHYWPNRSRQDMRQSAALLTDAQWDTILESLGGGNVAIAGTVIRENLSDFLLAKAQQDVVDLLGVDDTLTIDELEEFF